MSAIFPENRTRTCPICNSIFRKLIKSINGYLLVRCTSCRHVYVANPQIETTSHLEKNVDVSKCHFRHPQIIKQIKSYFFRNDKQQDNAHLPLKVAEIGAGCGYLAHLMQKEPNLFDYIGFEPSSERAAFCATHNLNVKQEFFKESAKTYDVVIMDNVLEHVLDPGSIITFAADSLRENGILIIIVPNFYDLRRIHPKWRRRHFWQPTCHINYFCYNDFSKIAKKHNLQLRVFGLETVSFIQQPSLFFKTLLDNLGLRIFGLYLLLSRSTKD